MVTPRLPDWLARLYPFAPASFTTPAGGLMSYLDEGPRSDEAVLLLHGNPTWSFYYRELVRELSADLRCIAPDHVGMGLSSKPAGYPYRLETRISDVGALVESLGLKRVHLVLHDWGGAIGFGWAARRPDLVGRIAILNTAAFHSRRIPARIALCRVPVLGSFLVRGLNAFARGATQMAVRQRSLTRDERRGYLFPYDSWGHRIAIQRFIRDIPLERSHPSREALESTARALPQFASHPILIAWGRRDFCFDDHFLTRWRELYPQARHESYDRAGHYVLEDAGAAVRGPLRRFLTSGNSA